ncbi:MAG: hypothetical protein HOM11_11605 [Methylococcales bacterium]|mgnify:FL=1|jgi:hypothetical protein|nr:hypothetical protein [Methylococcales bacterium]MBT7445450.1 hypothetical protein [Methylococcales bacterium]
MNINMYLKISMLFLMSIPAVKSELEHTSVMGYLPTMIYQHPQVASPFEQEFYFEVIKGESTQQIIVTYPADMERPTKMGVKIQLTGVMSEVALGGPEKTKRAYKNKVLSLKHWQYIQEGQ